MALNPSRSHTSRATVLVRCSSGERPMKRSALRIRCSERMFTYGDCSRCTASACLRMVSNIASPVVLTKSARTTVSFSVKTGARCAFHHQTPTARASTPAAAAAVPQDSLNGLERDTRAAAVTRLLEIAVARQAFQIRPHVGRRLVTGLPILVERFQDDALEILGY